MSKKLEVLSAGVLRFTLGDASQRSLPTQLRNQIEALILTQLASIAEKGHFAVDVTPVCDTSAYTSGDVLFDTVELPLALRYSGGTATLRGIVVRDEDDQTAAAMDLVFFRSNVSLGTVNVAPSISDANGREIIGTVNVPSANFIDVGGVKVATVANPALPVYATVDRSVFLSGITRGTPTQSASGLKLTLLFAQD